MNNGKIIKMMQVTNSLIDALNISNSISHVGAALLCTKIVLSTTLGCLPGYVLKRVLEPLNGHKNVRLKISA
jgi:hypothetical protein